VAVGVIAASAAGAAAAPWTIEPSPNPGGTTRDDLLFGVAATSPTDAWAVGYYSDSRPLIERWSGSAWKLQSSPDPGGPSRDNFLLGVTATSSSNAWAVGAHFNGMEYRPLIERWNGTLWKVQRSPHPRGRSGLLELSGVAATSSKNAWAVGYSNGQGAARTLILRWNGTAWRVQRSPNPGGPRNANYLLGVAATSRTNAWAVGYIVTRTADRTLIEHWDGSAWKVQRSPNPSGLGEGNFLYGVAATSLTDAWAVGEYYKGTGNRTLVEHWNGSAWKAQRSPNPGGSNSENSLAGVAAASPADAWAVGDYFGRRADRTLVEHWNGIAWTVQRTPNAGRSTTENVLSGVAATSPTNVWAVGHRSKRVLNRTLVLHCC
jgi:hypothetical protein